MINLSTDSVRLLSKCLLEHRPNLIWIINSEKSIEINNELGDELREAVSDELLSKGLNGDEPNEYGLRLEKLIDDIGRLFI